MKSGTILHVCLSERKGTVKKAVESATLRADFGLEGDAHGGDWHRQVSLLDEADIDYMRGKGLQLEAGAFGENLVVRGLDLDSLGIGTLLQAGSAELELTQIGKVCHHRCAIYYRAGDCIMPRAGLFCRVLRGGEVRPGTPLVVTREIPRETIQAAVVTVSDRCAARQAEDTAGPAVAELLQQRLGARIAARELVADEAEAIQTVLTDLADRGYDLLCTVGGTGCGPRDVTPEATRAIIAREVPGLAEAMRSASRVATPAALLQRGLCGIRGVTLIVNLPGSPRAATENLLAIIDTLPHAIALLRGDTNHSDQQATA